MPLQIGGSGTIKPYAKYNSKADKWFVRGDGGDVEIGQPTFVADFHNIQTGWFRIREGQAPERRMDPSLDRPAPSPGEDFKRGFVMNVFSQKFFDGLVELSSASIHMGNAIRELYQAYEEQRGSRPGQLPVVACTGSEAMKDKYGVNYRPKFELVKWVDRPADMPDAPPVDTSEIWQGEPVAASRSPATHVPPPASKPAAQPVADPMLEVEF